MNGVRLGVDVGGTFTDLVALVGHDIVTAKVPSTPRDQSQGVVNCLEVSGLASDDVASFAHGMTVATNALLERKGARTALVTTEGFRDLIEIGRQNRPSLYDLTRDRPETLVPRDLRFTVRERMGPDGEIEGLDDAALDELVERIRECDVEAVAVCLLFSFVHPDHERVVGDALRRALPQAHVSLSSEVLPEFREYERFSTTAANAYLGPKLSIYLARLSERADEAGLPAPLVMQSSGGVMEIDGAGARAVACVLSGPAGGVVGAAFLARASGYDDVLTFDMGGTSTDVAPVTDGEVQTRTESTIAGLPLKAPMVDVHTVSAGGGSLAWVDEGGALRVGPQSAGADPGPAAYAKGGERPTVTDANLLLGYLADEAKLGGDVVLRRDLAEKALGELGERLGMAAEDAALGIVQLANVEMVRALRVISLERGLDPREFALVAFGGAGPMHACALCEDLGMTKILVPKASGVLSALGLTISDLRRDYVSAFFADLRSADRAALEERFAEMESGGAKDLASPQFMRRADLRYRGQSFELTIDAHDLDTLESRWHDVHDQRYGYRMENEPVEIVNLRVTASVATDKPQLGEGALEDDARTTTRAANFDGEWAEVPVLDRARMGRGSAVEGPALVELKEATCVVRPGWRGAVDEVGTLVLVQR